MIGSRESQQHRGYRQAGILRARSPEPGLAANHGRHQPDSRHTRGGPEETEWLDAPLFPHDIPLDESRKVPFTSTVYIEREDFEETPSPGFKRLTLGGVVRLRYACIIRCTEVVRDDTGEIVELKCQVVPNSRSGADTSGVKVKGTIHWVSATEGKTVEIRMYDRLFQTPVPGEGGQDFLADLNPNSERRIQGAVVEPAFVSMAQGRRYQFTRTGYFWQDPVDSTSEHPVFNQIVGLRNSWAQKGESKPAPKPQPAKSSAPAQVQKERSFSDEELAEIQRLESQGVSRKNAETLATHSLRPPSSGTECRWKGRPPRLSPIGYATNPSGLRKNGRETPSCLREPGSERWSH